jgi:hypothetical protein
VRTVATQTGCVNRPLQLLLIRITPTPILLRRRSGYFSRVFSACSLVLNGLDNGVSSRPVLLTSPPIIPFSRRLSSSASLRKSTLMGTLPQRTVRTLALGAIGAMLLGAASRTKADAVSLDLTSSQITTTSRSTVMFDGTVTNNLGGALNATDFFFNLFGFDPASVNPIQDLGVASDFLIPNGTTFRLVALFDVILGVVPAGSSFPVDVVLQDINSDLSITQR